jgi:ketosteroid isomerase-like protein
MRKISVVFVILLVILGGIFTWRKLHPPLNDQQQIAAALDGICAAASARSPRGVANYLAKDFKIAGMGKSEFQNSLAGGILQYRVIELRVPNTKIVVNGEAATSEGSFNLSLKPEFNSAPEVRTGRFKLQWRKTDEGWLISKADGDLPFQN